MLKRKQVRKLTPCISSKNLEEEPVVILVNQVTEQQAILQEQILKSYRGNEIIEQIKKQKHEATRVVVYAANSDERIEQELKEYDFHLVYFKINFHLENTPKSNDFKLKRQSSKKSQNQFGIGNLMRTKRC